MLYIQKGRGWINHSVVFHSFQTIYSSRRQSYVWDFMWRFLREETRVGDWKWKGLSARAGGETCNGQAERGQQITWSTKGRSRSLPLEKRRQTHTHCSRHQTPMLLSSSLTWNNYISSAIISALTHILGEPCWRTVFSCCSPTGNTLASSDITLEALFQWNQATGSG